MKASVTDAAAAMENVRASPESATALPATVLLPRTAAEPFVENTTDVMANVELFMETDAVAMATRRLSMANVELFMRTDAVAMESDEVVMATDDVLMETGPVAKANATLSMARDELLMESVAHFLETAAVSMESSSPARADFARESAIAVIIGRIAEPSLPRPMGSAIGRVCRTRHYVPGQRPGTVHPVRGLKLPSRNVRFTMHVDRRARFSVRVPDSAEGGVGRMRLRGRPRA